MTDEFSQFRYFLNSSVIINQSSVILYLGNHNPHSVLLNRSVAAVIATTVNTVK